MSMREMSELYKTKIKSGGYTLGAMFMDCMKAKDPQGIFQIDAGTGEEETNASVLSRSIRLARSFRNIGLKPGDVLALGGKNHLDLHIPFYAAMFNGYPIVGVDPYFKYGDVLALGGKNHLDLHIPFYAAMFNGYPFVGVDPYFKYGDVLALGGKNHLDLHIPFYAAMFNGYPIVGVDPYFKYGDVLALGGKNHLDLHIPFYAAMFNGYPIVGVDPYFKYGEFHTYINAYSNYAGTRWLRCIRLARSFRNIGLKPGDVLALGGKNHLDLHIPFYAAMFNGYPIVGVDPYFKYGDVLALGGKNHLDLHIPFYAAMFNGYPIVGVDPYFKYDEIRNLFKITSPKIAFCQQDHADVYAKAAKDLGLDVKIVTFDGDTTLSKFIEENDDKDANDKDFQLEEYDTDKIYACLVTTSGTTGMPKVAAFKHDTLLQKFLAFLPFYVDLKYDKPPLLFHNSPVQWISSYFNTLFTPVVNQIKLQTSITDDIEHIIDIINKYKPSSMMASPSTMSFILQHEKHCDLTCFNVLTITGSKCYKELAIAIKARLKPTAMLMEAYGQTETIGAVLQPNPFAPLGSCGTGAMPTTEVKLVDPETGDEIKEPNVPGELWIKGPSFDGYYNNPEETAKSFTTDGWYKTGDLLYRDENNNYYFYDRIKMLIKYRNYHINPSELEEVISALEGVLEVSVVGIPHPEDSQRPAACVVRKPGYHVTAQQIKDHVANTLSASKQLRGGVVFMESLPKTSSGKIARAQLNKLVPTLERE
ncbi:AMP-binding enzyme domain-containing protein [Phthorimaea operculella]|nr:AMP-binding enzyme domain-containing protein [Phthorimaea operculella]